MPWLLIWTVLILLAVLVLALLAWRLWQATKALTSELGAAMRRVDELTAAFDTLADASARGAGPDARSSATRHL